MFIDMKDSTKIAEKLGHEQYFEFLKSYYNDLSDSIINNNGEVYQYIGDEVVISWALKKNKAILKALTCFFEMKLHLAHHKERYKVTYGVSPDFKGAIHAGEVTIGEIGALKKDIFFTGDVLNTTSRLQSLCSTYQSDLLVSEFIYNAIEPSSQFLTALKDTVTLKGKNQPITIYTVTKK